MRTVHWVLVLVLAVIITGVVSQRLTAARVAPPPSPLRPVGAIRDVMKGIVEPSSNVVFQSTGYIINEQGVQDLTPKNDDEWANVEHNALMLTEAANLLKMPGRRVARPEDTAPSTSDEAPELTPTISAKIEADRDMWNQFATALQEQGVAALAAARERNVDRLAEVGDAIDKACENCHLQYWYPEEDEHEEGEVHEGEGAGAPVN